MAELNVNDVVKIRKGKFGVVSGFNKKPCVIVFEAFVSPTSRYDANLKHKNHDYDIVEVYDGKKVANYKDVYRKSFDPSNLKLLYREGE